MDEDRRLRFLVAPILFFSSLASGLLLDPLLRSSVWQDLEKLPNQPITALIVALAGGGIILFASGFVIGTITYVLLRGGRALLLWSRSKQHEVALPEDTLRLLWAKLKIPGEVKQAEELYVGVTFDHGILQKRSKGVHEWLVRRWSAFALNCTLVTALALSLFTGWLAGIPFARWWWWVSLTIVALAFCRAAAWAWGDTMGMLVFQAKLPWDEEPSGGAERDRS